MSEKLELLRAERSAVQMDLSACRRSYSILSEHVRTLMNSTATQFFLNWAGKDAMMGSMEICINHLEELLEQFDRAIEDIEQIDDAGDNVVPLTEKRKREKS